MFSVVKDLQQFATNLQTDWNALRTEKVDEKEKYKRIISLGCRVIGIVGVVVGGYLHPLAVAAFVLGHDLITIGNNYRVLVESKGADMADKVKAFILEHIRATAIEHVKYDPVLHDTWVSRHLYLFVTEYEHESLKGAKAN